MRIGIAEILEKANAETKKADKVAFLQKHYSSALQKVIEYAINPAYEFALPPGSVPYKTEVNFGNENNLYTEVKRIYLFTKNGNPNLKQMRREMLFIDLLGYVHPKDAELLIAMKDKQWPYKGLTKAVLKEAMPTIALE